MNEQQRESKKDKAYWARAADDVLDQFNVSKKQGLSSQAVHDLQKRYGPNRLKDTQSKSIWVILANQFKSLIILLLAAAAGLSFVFGDILEGIAIAVVIGINTAIGFFTELKAVRSMEALRSLGSVSSRVRRDNEIVEIPAEEIVPGDIVIIEGGDIVTADIRLIEASRLQANESTLTGESMPVGKQTEPVKADTELAERKNMLFKGTAITRGSAEGVVTGIGMDTELGKISSLVEHAEEEITPLEQRLNTLGHKLIWVTLIIAVLIAGGGIVAGKKIFLMIETSIALAVAAIPEGLPIVATLALARGMLRMARRNALVNRLSAVETLGATNIIFTDKTGTLTENRMTVAHIILAGGVVDIKQEDEDGGFYIDEKRIDPDHDALLKEALQIGVLCNNASLSEKDGKGSEVSGDPLEVALLIAGAQADIRRYHLAKIMPEVREEAFDPEIKMMATFHEQNDHFYVAVKGAPEAVIENCQSILTGNKTESLTEDTRREWLKRNDQMAEKGLRMLALARKIVKNQNAEAYEDLTLVGIVGLHDPPRQ
jgi:Ca2+-transporting ATPase